MSTAAAAYAALHVPDTEALRRSLGELGEGLVGHLAELQARPDLDRCERLLINLEGAKRVVAIFRDVLICEGIGDRE